ncbi:MAG: hypothetical protein CL878_14750 [Dehalococcoidia bacterium]|nr:hypothetical protein [Dehalococcoidia bacterium]
MKLSVSVWVALWLGLPVLGRLVAVASRLGHLAPWHYIRLPRAVLSSLLARSLSSLLAGDARTAL